MRPALNCLMIVFMAACIAQTSQTFAREELAGRRDHHDVFSEKAVAMDSFTPARYQKVLVSITMSTARKYRKNIKPVRFFDSLNPKICRRSLLEVCFFGGLDSSFIKACKALYASCMRTGCLNSCKCCLC
ncbi:hypothetical protein KP509_28G006500 [Ceratopteris richardii]|uniref:Uncharacterized protein n=1 Tax=Ceratopteris richardii TaxID=49495 RepID=A0A8T2R995_CERRI|nr:hypothetical protein KP509_28G006500 [Ceratopteris richardii]